MKSTSFITLILVYLSSISCVAAESIEGNYETTVYRNCWPTDENYTPKGCKVKDGLKIQSRNKSSYYLWVHTESDFGHFCSFRGVGHLENGALVSKDSDCTVSVKWIGDVANVESIGDGCSQKCGANALLETSGLKKKTRLTGIRAGLADKRSLCGLWFFELSGLLSRFVTASPSI